MKKTFGPIRILLSAVFALSAFQLLGDEAAGVPEATVTTEQKIITLIRQQRDSLSQALLDAQAQLQLAATEIDALRKQIAGLSKPKPEGLAKETKASPAASSSEPAPK